MSNFMGIPSKYGLENHGLRNLNMQYWTLTTPALVERIVSRREGIIAHEGAVVVRTGIHTGRSANDKYIVQEGDAVGRVSWGKTNRPISPEHFDRLHQGMTAYFQGRDVFIQDTTAGAHPAYKLPIRVITENAWHSLFARNMFLRCRPEELPDHKPEFTIIQAAGFRAHPELDGTTSDTFVVLNLERRMILIGGTAYAGEIKKAVFTVLNYILPLQGVLSMHCSATVGQRGDTALFFGLSGTGKTTLSSDPERAMIGDDEHGWGDDGVFNFEGGCYAKTIRLRRDLEPLIFAATRRFGTILENVYIDITKRQVNFDDDSVTENSRAAYPLGFIPNTVPSGMGGHPQNIFFLTADAFGILPPLARLTPEQAMYHYISGYTAKLAGTEKGLGKEPQFTFSSCFSAPFLPLHPREYADLLGEKISRHKVNVWLINTGWSGGAYGVGQRIHLPYTRAMVKAVLSGALDDVPFHREPYFGLYIPETCPDVPGELLDASSTWSSRQEYDLKAGELAGKFKENFVAFADMVSPEVVAAGPQ